MFLDDNSFGHYFGIFGIIFPITSAEVFFIFETLIA